ncbi:hypothetical protein F4818DRAFT_438820 [Hypoxylon cercidicola]|nr:hypothetical protein F4818DRAFT_438820 [Hypoxylon cercidicola]
MTYPRPPHEYDEDGRLSLPGFGLPIDYEPPSPSYFFHPFSYNRFESDGLKLREIRMMHFINMVTDKPNWEENVFDDQIVSAWLAESSLDYAPDLDGDVYFSERMYKACVDELREKAVWLKRTGIVNVLDAELAVAKSDTVVSPTLASSLRASAKALENVRLKDRDWEPGSNEKVLNLLDPSLYPLTYGITRVLPRERIPLQHCGSYIGKGEPISVIDPSEVRRPAYFGTMQWLPSSIRWTGTGLRITSYIHNLKPTDHSGLYGVLESFVAAAIPLWEECLFSGQYRRSPRIPTCPSGNSDYVLAEGAEPSIRYRNSIGHMDYVSWVRNRILRWPEPSRYKARLSRLRPQEVKPNLREDFPGGLQVVFRLFNIHLKPDDPVYPGGIWNYGGTLNDRIVATALYYYDAENVGEGIISFAHVFDSDALTLQPPLEHAINPGEFPPPQYEDYECIRRWYDISSGSRFQIIGTVATRPGRLLAFPSVFQHSSGPFALENPTQPGHLKVLAMYLVDPNIRVLSTDVVPPQRRDWWADEVRGIKPFSQIAQEIFDNIIRFVEDVPMSPEQGREARAHLMEEHHLTGLPLPHVIDVPHMID